MSIIKDHKDFLHFFQTYTLVFYLGDADRGDIVLLTTNSTCSLLVCRILGTHGEKLQTSDVNAQGPDSKIDSDVALPQPMFPGSWARVILWEQNDTFLGLNRSESGGLCPRRLAGGCTGDQLLPPVGLRGAAAGHITGRSGGSPMNNMSGSVLVFARVA